jgi:poly(3-hydroxybutyrate) depolymerase
MHRIGWALAVTAALASSPAWASDIRIETKDGTRTALVVPAGPVPAPTIIVLHGATINAHWTMRGSGFAEAAAAHSFTAVFPDGINRVWNDGREAGPISRIDDVGWIGRHAAPGRRSPFIASRAGGIRYSAARTLFRPSLAPGRD